MDRLLQNDFTVRALSLLLAVALWFVAAGERGAVQKPFSHVPIHPRNLSGELAITAIKPSSVTVTVRADRSQMASLDRTSFDAFVNLTGSRPGTFGLEVQVTVPMGVTLIDVTPRVVDVTLESMVEKDVPVQVKMVGTPSPGYSVQKVEPELESVRLRGPENEVARAVAAVGQVSVDGEDDSLVTEVRLFPHDEENSSLKETNVIPAYVNVSVAIAEVREEKEVPVNPVLEDKPAEGFRVDSVTLEPETVTVVGARSVVNKLDSISTEGVSIEEAAEDVVVEVPLQLPQGLDWTEPALVKVRVGIVSE